MNQAMHEIVSGALVQEMRLNVLANNVSNINTLGFKGDSAFFQVSDLTEFTKGDSQEGSVSGMSGNAFSSLPVGTFTNFSGGHLKSTGNALDLALDGNGFFCVETPEGVQYTRKGNFSLNQEGLLVTQNGLPVLGEAGTIRIDGRNVHVDTEGNIEVDGNIVDTIKILDFDQPYPLKKVADTSFVPNDPGITGNKAEGVNVRQGLVELSNVDAIKMMTEMIDVLRGYQSYQKVIQSLNDITLKSINEVGRLA